MPLSPYVIAFPAPVEDSGQALFCTRTGALIVAPGALYHSLAGGSLPAEYGKTLIETGFWVDDPEAERRAVLRYLDDLNRVTPNLIASVILGMECNFACRYCYEGAQKGRRAMTDAIADRLVAYLEERFGPGKTKLRLDLYGGETLLYKARIISLARRLKPFVEARGGEFVFNIVSNGSLLTPEVVAELTPWGLDGVKVTVDGPPENHDHFRPFKSGAPSFEVVVRNLAAVAGMTNLRLGGNYTADNFRDFASVLDHLSGRGLTPDKVEVVNFNPVMQVRDRVAMNEYGGGCAGMHEPWLIEAGPRIRDEVFRRGYAIAELGPASCAVEMDDAFTVHYDGTLYKCAVLVGHEQYAIGDLWRGVDPAYREAHAVGHWQREQKCRDCVSLPMCFGGCRYTAFQRDGHMRNVDCQQDFLDATLETILRQDLKYRYRIA